MGLLTRGTNNSGRVARDTYHFHGPETKYLFMIMILLLQREEWNEMLGLHKRQGISTSGF